MKVRTTDRRDFAEAHVPGKTINISYAEKDIYSRTPNVAKSFH